MKQYLTLILFATISTAYGQDYDTFIQKADSCYEAKNYKAATVFFEKAFKAKPDSKKNFYDAACSASLANDKKNSLKWLEAALNNGFDNLNHISADTDLDNVRNEKEFKKIIAEFQKKLELIEANYDKPLQKELLEISKNDQDIRHQYIAAQKKYGLQGKETDSLGKLMNLKDSLNLIKVVKILDEKGWVGKDKVGSQANQAIYLVIQHSDLKTQQKYLPMMREAVKKGNATPSSLAFLEDRVAIREGRKQIYGSQIGTNPVTKIPYVLPLEDPDNVDKRRTDAGLGSLASYIRYWNITWNVDQYKKDLAEIEAMNKQTKPIH